MAVYHVDFNRKRIIDKVSAPKSRKIESNNIMPAIEDIREECVREKKAEPIKNISDINKISDYFIENKKYRDNMLFVVGINFGLRVSDLLSLRFSSLINENNTYRETFPILERKTKETRKVKRNRYITINDSVINAVNLYIEHNKVYLSDYMFRSESNRGKNKNEPLSRKSADRILKNAAEAVGLNGIHISTHSLRKTFGYHQMLKSNNDPRKLLLLQKIFGHSSVHQTLDYIGITNEEIKEAYMELNLGMNIQQSLIDSKLEEEYRNIK